MVAEGLAREPDLPEESLLWSTSSSALVIFSGSPSRYSIRQVVHLA